MFFFVFKLFQPSLEEFSKIQELELVNAWIIHDLFQPSLEEFSKIPEERKISQLAEKSFNPLLRNSLRFSQAYTYTSDMLMYCLFQPSLEEFSKIRL